MTTQTTCVSESKGRPDESLFQDKKETETYGRPMEETETDSGTPAIPVPVTDSVLGT